MHPIGIAEELWPLFKRAFCETLESSGRDRLLEAWKSIGNKSHFYEWSFVPEVGRRLGLKTQIERLRVDFTFLNDDGVPMVAIEAENAHLTAEREIDVLCSLAAPLKVLILSCDWAAEEDSCLPSWLEIVRKHHSIVAATCRYAIVIGEWDEGDDTPLIFKFLLFDSAGQEIERTEHVVSFNHP